MLAQAALWVHTTCMSSERSILEPECYTQVGETPASPQHHTGSHTPIRIHSAPRVPLASPGRKDGEPKVGTGRPKTGKNVPGLTLLKTQRRRGQEGRAEPKLGKFLGQSIQQRAWGHVKPHKDLRPTFCPKATGTRHIQAWACPHRQAGGALAISLTKLTFVKGDTHGLPMRLKRLRATFQEGISPAEEIGVWERLRKTQLVRAGRSG